MADLIALRRDARQVYERARLRTAMRVAVIIVPLTVVCAYETRAVFRCVALGVALLTVAVALRWRQRHGFAVVSTGLRSGALPLAAALGLCRFVPSCPPDVALALCGTAGLLAGGLAGRSLIQPPAVWQQSLGAAAVAALTAALGCLAFGVGIAAGASAAVALAILLAARVLRPAAV